MFLAFSPEHMCSDLIQQIKSLLSLNWQVSKVLIVKFQASTLDQCHHLFINLSCISAGKPLNAQYCAWARIIAAVIATARLLYCIYTLLMCTNTASSTEAEQRLCSEALTSEVGLLKNIRAYKKWIPLSMEKKSFPSKESNTKILQEYVFRLHGPCRRFRGDHNDEDTRTFCEKFLYNAIASTDNVTAQQKNCPSSGVDDRPGRDLFRVLKRSPISQPHTLGLRRRH